MIPLAQPHLLYDAVSLTEVGFCEVLKSVFCLFGIIGSVNSFELLHYLLQILVGNKSSGISEQVHNACLMHCLWVYGFNSLGHSFEAVCYCDQNVAAASSSDFIKYACPVGGAFIVGEPHSENFSGTVRFNC
ncbi:unknown [Proteobacteria bacterium CAG:139]|nr:unknown [Proteobacteria bacterium CAG:139]